MNMKKIILLFSAVILSISFISCGTTPETNETITEAPVINDDDVIDVEEEAEIIINEPEEIEEEDDDEYLRSTNDLIDETVTKEEFAEDKAQILKIISDLQNIMQKQDVNAWLKYIDPVSIKYYSNPQNIRKAQKKLPNKAIVLNGIGDYFKFVFIPSRKRSEVKEIRYISKTNIKAVNVKEDGGITVYYQFVKVNDKWLVHIPAL